MSIDPLRRLLHELQHAELERVSAPRHTTEYEHAARRVEQVAKAVWGWPVEHDPGIDGLERRGDGDDRIATS